ncbi:uncharacterized protein PHALS_12003 [Plasmopara halstedii]|uniref:Uncharacterized protein n=1 Tax=Plasmopara halstedii TaxID=4781 RepID=A0A0P1AL25_PLAHL|nr:uncharacterized protein PHALS_12003 [Plasmopara halstedii]CEG41666.1 hypothetical protein PHALS_12003 [Plasmopara halstedii]|eukprot:XP_024578035.1 hypothetical protein PHALS_12003 [Plasmopara halstedii]
MMMKEVAGVQLPKAARRLGLEEGPSSRFSRMVLHPRQLRPATELLEPVL